jgi:hypothetical protein
MVDATSIWRNSRRQIQSRRLRGRETCPEAPSLYSQIKAIILLPETSRPSFYSF